MRHCHLCLCHEWRVWVSRPGFDVKVSHEQDAVASMSAANRFVFKKAREDETVLAESGHFKSLFMRADVALACLHPLSSRTGAVQPQFSSNGPRSIVFCSLRLQTKGEAVSILKIQQPDGSLHLHLLLCSWQTSRMSLRGEREGDKPQDSTAPRPHLRAEPMEEAQGHERQRQSQASSAIWPMDSDFDPEPKEKPLGCL